MGVEQIILDRYADLIVSFGAGNGKPIKPGSTVYIQVPQCAEPLLAPLVKYVLAAEAHPLVNFVPDGLDKLVIKNGTLAQASHQFTQLDQARVKEADYWIRILSEADPREKANLSPQKVQARNISNRAVLQARTKKELRGKLTWTLALFPTEKQADEANLTLDEYWGQVIKACYLDHEDPVSKFKDITTEIKEICDELTNLKLQGARVESRETDIYVQIGKNRRWLAGTGRNIPSFEIFTSPNWRGTNGKILFSEPLYREGRILRGIRLAFKNGIVQSATAEEGQEFLEQIMATKGMNKLGEYSLTDKRHSRIDKFMAETLYDENRGGEFGNTHMALGDSFAETYIGDHSPQRLRNAGFNTSVDHVDIIDAKNRMVTAKLPGGKSKVIYENGLFTL